MNEGGINEETLHLSELNTARKRTLSSTGAKGCLTESQLGAVAVSGMYLSYGK